MLNQTVYKTIQKARVKIHDEDKAYFSTDSSLLDIINEIIMEIHSYLMFIESNLAYDHLQITTSSSVGEYALGVDHSGILRDGVWRVDYENPLDQVDETDKRFYHTTGTQNIVSQPEAYYIKAGGDTMGFLGVPDGAYTFAVYYWKPVTELTETTSGSAEVLPFNGIFDGYIQRRLVVELLEIQERDNSRQALLTGAEWDRALTRVYSLGVREKRAMSDMFSVEGV